MRLADYIADRGLKRIEFARAVGVSPSHLSHLCSGDGWPGRDVAMRIRRATAGAVTPDDFLPDDPVRGAEAATFRPAAEPV